MNNKENENDFKGDVKGSAKMTFGLTEKNLEVIKKYTSRWEGAEFDRDTWIRIGEEIGWDALTACLWYFRKHYQQKLHIKTPKEIEKLAEAHYGYNYDDDTNATDNRRSGFEEGYTQCQQNKT